MSILLDGKHIAQQRQAKLQEKVEHIFKEHGKRPTLSILLVGENNPSQVYVRNKKKIAERLGMQVNIIQLSENTQKQEVADIIKALNIDPTIHGILLQLPLPAHFTEDDKFMLISLIHPNKDVDGITPFNAGRLLQGYKPLYIAATAKAVQTMLSDSNIPIAGKHAVIVGRSIIVGRPLAALLLTMDATVTLTHSRTNDLASHTKLADILIVAAGKTRMITADFVKKNAVIVDVGINSENGKLVGDVDFQSVSSLVHAISPVPGGVGPLTIMSLLENTFDACIINETLH